MTASEFTHANVSRLTDALLVGGDIDLFDAAQARRQQAELVEAGLTHVVDCRLEWSDRERWRGTGVRYLHAPIDDAGQRVPASWFAEQVAQVQGFLTVEDPLVLVHCHMGVNRGPSLAFAVLLAQGWEPAAALAHLQAVRPIAYAFYAEDALEWWLEARGIAGPEAEQRRQALAAHRARHRVEVEHVIADLRSAERDARPTSWDS